MLIYHYFFIRYKTHGDHHNSIVDDDLTNEKEKKSISTISNKHSRGIIRRRRNAKNCEHVEDADDETSDDDEKEPMDFEDAFGLVSDIPKLEHIDFHQNGIIDNLNTVEGDSYFDLSTKIDLKTYTQPVLISSAINLNPLAAVIFCLIKILLNPFIAFDFVVIQFK